MSDVADLSSTLKVGPDTQVTLHFALKLEDGSVVDSTFDRKPATFTVGDGSLLKGFEESLFGMAAGEKDALIVKPEQGFGQHNPSNIQQMPRDQFGDDVELVEGLMLSFADAQKAELPGVVSSFDDQVVHIDFNHPLAGRDILFDVEIIDVQPAQAAAV